MLKVGDKVRCIDDVYLFGVYTPKEYNDINLPKKDIVYTIRDAENPGVRLVEIKNPIIWHDIGGNKEPTFTASRFVIDIAETRNDKLESIGI